MALRLMLLLALSLLGACSSTETESAAVKLIRAPESTVQPAGHATPTKASLRLPHRWDQMYPGLGGRVVYRLTLPPAGSTGLRALWIESVGNQAQIRVNGVVVQEWGALGDADTDASRMGQVVLLADSLLHDSKGSELVIEATMQPLRAGGLSAVWYGSASRMEALLARQRMLHQYTAVAYVASLLLMGGLAAGLWWRQRDPLYGCFSLAALFGTVRHLNQIWFDVPVPWPLWGALLAIGYGCHLALTARFVLLLLGTNPPWLVRIIHFALGAAVIMPAMSFWLLNPTLWTNTLIGLQLIGIVCFAVALREALRTHRPMAWLLVASGGLLLLAGLHDILMVRKGLFGGSSLSLTPHAMFFLVLILAGLVVARYNRSVADYKALSNHLAERVAVRERELGEAFEALRVQRHDQAVLSERQRIMREIHDGIGSQLVGLLSMVEQQQPDRAAIEEQVKVALDEMRMAVDSLQPMHSDLTTVLATLRYRVQGRLQAAGIEVVWDIADLPPISQLSPQAVLQVQRILLEALTNVLKHAHATRVVMRARWRASEPPAVLLELSDNGVGLPAVSGESSRGHGVINMRARAGTIGASLRIDSNPNGGTRVTVEWPIRDAAARDDGPLAATDPNGERGP